MINIMYTCLNNKEKILQVVFGAVSICFILIFVFNAFERLQYKYELTNYEYQSLIQTVRVLQMQSVYSKPSPEYVSMIYTPIYYYLSSIFVWIFGKIFFPLRLLSLLSSVGTGIVIYKYLKKGTGSALAGIIGAGFFASCYVIGGMVYDVARVDSLALFLYSAGIYSARFINGKRGVAAAAAAFISACLTKQTYLIFVFPLFFLINKHNHKNTHYFLIVTGIAFLMAVSLLQYTSGGWFMYYIFILPSKHGFHENIIGRLFLITYVYRHLIIAAIACGVLISRQKYASKAGLLTGIFTFMVCVMYTLKVGGSNNMMLPVFAFSSILFATTVNELLRVNNKIRYFSFILLIVYLLNGLAFRPNKPETGGHDEIIRNLSAIKGEVLYPSNPYILHLSGKKPSAHTDLMSDLLGGSGSGKATPEGLSVVEEVRKKIVGKQYSALLFSEKDRSGPLYSLLETDIARYYSRSEKQISDEVVTYVPR